MRPDVAKDASTKVAQRVEEVIGREGGKLTQVETWGRRQLAYPIGKIKRGVYVYTKYLGGGAVVNEIERNLRMLDDVIKYMTVQTGTDIDAGSVTVDPEAVKFEAPEPATEEELVETRERELGLVEHHETPDRRDDEYADEYVDEPRSQAAPSIAPPEKEKTEEES
jgi:small subunit ribosomal protein S6